jgi:hypothetical protein
MVEIKESRSRKRVSNSIRHKRESTHYKSKMYLLSLIIESLVVSIRDVFKQYYKMKPDCIELTSKKMRNSRLLIGTIVGRSLTGNREGTVLRIFNKE